MEGGELRVDECTGEYSLSCEWAEVDALRVRCLPKDSRSMERKHDARLFVVPQSNDLQEGFAGGANAAHFVASHPIEHQQEPMQVVSEGEEMRHFSAAARHSLLLYGVSSVLLLLKLSCVDRSDGWLTCPPCLAFWRKSPLVVL